jgi:hypothetical protein
MAKKKDKRPRQAAETNAGAEPPPEALAEIENMQPVEMPEWYASGAQLVWAGNDVQLIFNKAVLLGTVTHGKPQTSHTVALIAPVGLVRMSAATLKDVTVLLSEQIAKHEAEHGAIETSFTKTKERERTSSSKKT